MASGAQPDVRLVAEVEPQLADPRQRKRWLILDEHPEFPGHWIVESFSNDYLFDLGETLGSYRAVAPAGLQSFLEAAEQCSYQVAWFDQPSWAIDHLADLTATPEVSINSTFAGTVNGMLPFQVEGFNMLKDLDYGVAQWSTGTGKTVLASALIKYHAERENFDLCLFVAKRANKVNTARKLQTLAGLDSFVIHGPTKRRHLTYAAVGDATRPIMVLNYEQFRYDFVERDEEDKLVLTEWGETFFPNRRLLVIFDEMPTKLKTRGTQLYKAVCKCLYRTSPPQVSYRCLRPASLRTYMLSATPIENSPEDLFNNVRLLDGGRTLGTVSDFNTTYVRSWNYFDPSKPESFHDLERMRLKLAPFVHQANKSDPEIAAMFPDAIEEVVYIDWDEKNRVLYEEIQEFARRVAEEDEEDDISIFGLLTILQMMCDAPEMIQASDSETAARLSHLDKRLRNQGHPKFETLRDLLDKHGGSQVVLYSRFNDALMPYLEGALQEWEVSYGRYVGSDGHRQEIQDGFQAGRFQVFLASDLASDSLDLDAGNVVIDYDLPWKWTTVVQRHNRVHRPTSQHETVYYYSLVMEDSVEERTLTIIDKKKHYHTELFESRSDTLNTQMTKEELMWVLTGR